MTLRDLRAIIIVEEKEMKLFIAIFILSIFICTSCLLAEDTPDAANSRPNVSGGYDYYDSAGNKTSSSQSRSDGGFDYYDQYGNKTGSLIYDEENERFTYIDAENVQRGTLSEDPYGGYRYTTQGEDVVTSKQMQIRRDYGYTDTYGKGVETLSSDTVRGIDSTSDAVEDGLSATMSENTDLTGSLSTAESDTSETTEIVTGTETTASSGLSSEGSGGLGIE